MMGVSHLDFLRSSPSDCLILYPSVTAMPSPIETIFDEAETRYLNSEELGLINQYVDSLPVRLETYRAMRDRELEIMQAVADQLQAAMPHETTENLERSIKNALLVVRYCAMGLLLNDASFVQDRLLNWLTDTMTTYNTQAIDVALHRLLNQRLVQTFTPSQINLLSPFLKMVQTKLVQALPTPV